MVKLLQACTDRDARAAEASEADPARQPDLPFTAASCVTRRAAMELVPGLQLAELPPPDYVGTWLVAIDLRTVSYHIGVDAPAACTVRAGSASAAARNVQNVT
jgi:hypothetical protein